MKERTRRIFIMIVMAALIVSLMAASFAALTYGRYSGGRFDENSPYEDYIDFVGATAYEVSSPEELVNAINNGYSYIKIAADAEEPFVVNSDIANVYTNLVIDVNGKTVIRNSRNPVLDVSRNISVVLVYDSSEDAVGGFYNPVGSALQTSGGTLTVGAGVYKSGPNVKAAQSVTTAEIPDVFVRDGDRASVTAYYKRADSAVLLPKLTEDVYLKNDVKEGYLRNDTYLIYTKENNCYEKDRQLLVNCTKTGTEISGTSFRVESNVASCDFYYYYPVGGTPGTEDAFQEYAVVYGYHDVKALAEDCTDKTDDQNHTDLSKNGLVWPYAAIRSEAGNTHARGGKFYTYFGEENTYSIYSKGGIMTVGSAGSSSAAGPAFKAVGEGVCIRSQTTGAAVGSSDAASLEISGGSFSSEIGDTIQMEGGAVKITGGAFEKNDSNARPSGTLDEIEASRTALVHMRGGDLTIDGTVTGANYSVTMAAGSEQTPLTNVFGIYSEQSSSGDSGTVTVSGCDISVNGTYSAGVLSSAGTVNVGGAENGKPQTKIAVAESIEDGLLTSSAVSSEGGTVNLRNTVIITSDSLGITARGTVNVKGGETTVTTPNATGVYVNNGTLNVDAGATLGVESTVNADLKWVTPPDSSGSSDPVTQIYNGVFVHGGSLVSEGTLNVTHTGVENESHKSYDALKIRSYAVRVEAAATGGNSEVSIAGGTISNSVGGGVSVNGGTVTLGVRGEGGPTIGTTGVSFGDENTSAGGGNWKYYENKTGGHAVEVNGGALLVYGGLYTAALGNGILVRGGNAWVLNGTFQGNDTGNYRGNYGEGNLPAGPAAYYALKLLGGSVTTFGGTFGTYVVGDATYTAEGSSAFVTGVSSSQATANIFGGSFKVGGQAGFSVYQNVALEFTPNKKVTVGEGSEAQTLQGSAVEVSAATTAIAIENTTNENVSVTINGGTFESTGTDDGKRDGIWYSNPYAKLSINQLKGQSTKISANEEHGIRLVDAPATKNGVKITGGTITGAQHGILYVDTTDNGSAASVNDGLLIEGGTITGSNGSGLYFAVNPWQNGGTNNVAIVGGTFNGEKEKKGSDQNPFYINGAISAPSSGATNIDYSGLGKEIRLGDILKTHTGDGKVGYVEGNDDWDGNSNLGDNYKYSIAVTVSSMESVSIKLYNQ